MRSMFVRQTVAGVYPVRYRCCSLFGLFDVDFTVEGAFHREFTFNACNIDLGRLQLALRQQWKPA